MKPRHQRYILISRKVHYVSAEVCAELEGFMTIVRVDTYKTRAEAEEWAKRFERMKFTTTIKTKYKL